MSDTLPQMVLRQTQRLGARTALRRKEGGAFRDISWADLGDNIRNFGRALLALGLERGDRVAIMAANGPEWVYADLGTMSCGALSVPVYHTEGEKAVLHILRDSGSRFLFLQASQVTEEVVGRLAELSCLESVILLDNASRNPKAITAEEFRRLGQETPEETLERELAKGTGDNAATIVYTSGTTGTPKGVILTHDNFLSNIKACLQLFDIGANDETLSFLPLSHVFERMAGYYLMLQQGATISYAENFESVPANLQEVRPTVVISVPRLYEKMYARIMERVLSGSWPKKQIFFGALKAARTLVQEELAGRKPGILLRITVSAARKRIFSKLRKPLGGRLRFFVSGGAPLTPDIAEFFLSAGIPIYEGYGLTETSPVIAANHEGAIRPGTVGRPIPGTEVRIAEDGEILVKGPGVFLGYWNLQEDTEDAFTEGWFKTGDIGKLDSDGFLHITDRKKDLIVTAGGENIAPQYLENLLKTDKFLANTMVCGDRKPYLTALLVPNFDNLEKYAHFKEIDFLNHCDLVNHPRILDLIRRRIDKIQSDLPPIQRIKRFTLLSRDFGKEELTPTLKLKRHLVKNNYQKILEGMYRPQGKGTHDSGFCVVENGPEEVAK
jgi:long-chain acyl-CoA synthetase